jgi:polyketide biosynthesis acyl carrier protein
MDQQRTPDPGDMKLSQDHIAAVIKQHIADIMLDVEVESLTLQSSMRELGLNSIDRVDVIVNSLESLGQNIPLVEFASARTLGDIVKIIGDHHASR